MEFWNNKSVLVTGGNGFLGTHLVARLKDQGANVTAPTKQQYDLVNAEDIKKMYDENPSDMVIHLAARRRYWG